MNEIPDFENLHGNAFAIYQLSYSHENHLRRFEPLEHIRARGLPVQRKQYDLLYAASLNEPPSSILTCLDDLYMRSNADHPADAHGHSLVVGDVLAVKLDGKVYSYFVDSFGFSSLPDFFTPDQPLKNAGIAAEKDYDQHQGVISNGTPTTLAECQRKLAEKKEQLEAESLPLISFQGKPALLADWRIDASLLPDGIYHYDLRHGDDWGTPITAENYVRVNFFGTLLMKEALQLPADGRMNLDQNAIDYLDGTYLSLSEFQKGQTPVLQEQRPSLRDSLKKAKAKPSPAPQRRRKHMVR